MHAFEKCTGFNLEPEVKLISRRCTLSYCNFLSTVVRSTVTSEAEVLVSVRVSNLSLRPIHRCGIQMCCWYVKNKLLWDLCDQMEVTAFQTSNLITCNKYYILLSASWTSTSNFISFHEVLD